VNAYLRAKAAIIALPDLVPFDMDLENAFSAIRFKSDLRDVFDHITEGDDDFKPPFEAAVGARTNKAMVPKTAVYVGVAKSVASVLAAHEDALQSEIQAKGISLH